MKITAIDSPIESIFSRVDLYKDVSVVTMQLRQANSAHQKILTQQLITLGAENNIELYGPSPVIGLKDKEQFRDLVNMLYQHGYIDNTDRADIEPEIRSVERTLLYRKKITVGTYSVAQRDIIVMMIEPYLDALVELAESFEDIIPILAQTMLYAGHKDTWNIWFNTKFSHLNPAVSTELHACITSLVTITKGELDLISAFEQTGLGIPSLPDQRDIIINEFIKRFKDKFPEATNEYQQFYIERALNKLKTRQHIKMVISHNYTIPNLTGFPKYTPIKRCEITDDRVKYNPANLNYEVTSVIAIDEEQLLSKYNLARFPINAEDLNAAKQHSSTEVVRNRRDQFFILDGNYYPNMTPCEMLYCAIIDENIDHINDAISAFNIDVNVLLDDYNTPLMLAVRYNRINSVLKLIELGANINFVFAKENNNTALHYVSSAHNHLLINLLLESGALMMLDANGRLPLHWLFAMSRPEDTLENMLSMITLLNNTQLNQYRSTPPAFPWYSNRILNSTGGTNLVNNLNFLRDNEGNTCLHIAARNANKIGIIALLQSGASPAELNAGQQTPYDIIFNPRNNNPLNKDDEILSLLRLDNTNGIDMTSSK